MKDLDPEIKKELEKMEDMTDAEKKEMIEVIKMSQESHAADHRRISDTMSLENQYIESAIVESKTQ